MGWNEAQVSEDGKHYLIPIVDFDKIDDLPVDPYRLRMFDFRYSNYGMSFTVMARSKQQALDYLLAFFKDEDKKDDSGWYDDFYELWSGVIIEDPNTYPEHYDIIEYEEGGVLETEQS